MDENSWSTLRFVGFRWLQWQIKRRINGTSHLAETISVVAPLHSSLQRRLPVDSIYRGSESQTLVQVFFKPSTHSKWIEFHRNVWIGDCCSLTPALFHTWINWIYSEKLMGNGCTGKLKMNEWITDSHSNISFPMTFNVPLCQMPKPHIDASSSSKWSYGIWQDTTGTIDVNVLLSSIATPDKYCVEILYSLPHCHCHCHCCRCRQPHMKFINKILFDVVVVAVVVLGGSVLLLSSYAKQRNTIITI